ncbi:MAG: peptidylprolyl isomerase, partial [Bauldia sp.]
MDGSAAGGGELDFIGRGQTVKPFEEAAFALEVGAYTRTPVQSQFGWHVIKVEEKRKQPPPTFAEEGRRIREDLLAETFDQVMAQLRSV